MVDNEEITEDDNLSPLSKEERAEIRRQRYYKAPNHYKSMDKRKLAAVLFIATLLILSTAASAVHAVTVGTGSDTIEGPINNSVFSFTNNSITIPLKIYVGNIQGNTTWDQVGIYINGPSYNITNYTHDGTYTVPITFYNTGNYIVTLLSSTQNNSVAMAYSVTATNNLIFGQEWYVWVFIAVVTVFLIGMMVSVLRG